jgi:putative two-component system response regulator
VSLDAHILVVDDSASNLLLVERILQAAGYAHVETVNRSGEVVAYFQAHPPDVLLLDLHMPDPDGFEVMRLLAPWTTGATYIPVLALTADVSPETRHRALEAGARDLLTKPLDHIDVLLRVRNLLQTRELQLKLQAQNELLDIKIRERTQELDDARREAFEKLALAAEYRDDETREHTQRVGYVTRLLAIELGLDTGDAESLAQVAPLHDLGKIAISDAILLKPGRLNATEFAAMKEHAAIGAQIMSGSDSPLFTIGAQIALSHHERWDGSGYPNGLDGPQIPLGARIVAIVDAFDAISHERPYKPPWPIDQALDEIQRCSGSHFDPDIVTAFMRLDHPALVELPATESAAPLTTLFANAEHQTRDRELTRDLLVTVFEQLPQALLLATDDRRTIAANAMARRLLGVTKDELRRSRIDDFFSRDTRDALDALWSASERAAAGSAEMVLVRPDGHKIPIRTTARANLLSGHHLNVLEPLADS